MSDDINWGTLLQEYIVENRVPYGYSGHDTVPGWDHVGRLYQKSGSPLELIVALTELTTLLARGGNHECLQALDRTLSLAKRLAHGDLHGSVKEAFMLLAVPVEGELHNHRIHVACAALATLAQIEAAGSGLRNQSFWQSLIFESKEFSATAFFQFAKVDLSYAIEHMEECLDLDLSNDEKAVGLRGLQRDADQKGLLVLFYQHLEDVVKRRPELEMLCRKTLGAKFAAAAD